MRSLSDCARLPTLTRDFSSLKTASGLLCLMLFGAGLQGCASRPSPETPKSSRVTANAPEFYTVQPGDTVSKIAARYGLDYPEIGRLNQLNDQYTIYPNQRLRLRNRQSGRVAAPQAAPRPVSTTPVQATAPIRSQPLPSAPIAIQSATQPVTSQGLRWQWPTSNPILQDFNESAGVKGIRFDGKSGDPVLAAAAGEVVYANNGLTEYGNLVLLRHGNGYITAYAHNRRLLVQEGQTVSLGQPIAEMGNSGTHRIMLEFQVRKDGKPVNPTQVLPRR